MWPTGRRWRVSSASQIVDGLRKGGDAEFEFVVRAKARPVLLLSGRSDPHTGDPFALRLLRLEKLSNQERQRVEEHREPTLFPLPPKRFPDLADDSAAVVTAPIRLHKTALDTRKSLGRLDARRYEPWSSASPPTGSSTSASSWSPKSASYSTGEKPADSRLEPALLRISCHGPAGHPQADEIGEDRGVAC
jgi:hypothetical protein